MTVSDPMDAPPSRFTTPGGPQWRGKHVAAAAPRLRGWQRVTGASPLSRLQRRQGWRKLRLCVLLAACVALLGCLVNYLMFVPTQTPWLAICATDYESPLPPNAWAQEDLDALQDSDIGLDQKTVTVADLSVAWHTRQGGLHEFDRRLAECRQQAATAHAIVIYVSMHGAVDASGQPCLIPPGATPTNTQTWLPVRELLHRIQQQGFPDHTLKLLVLDCNRMLVNWSAGLLYNTFADRLDEELDRARIANFAILNSTSAGQIGWASSDLHGSVFAQYLRMGLAGDADQPQQGGNDDRRVSLHELHGYLTRHVDHWARQNRDSRQMPLLIPHDISDQTVALTLNPPALRRLISHSRFQTRAAPAVSAGNLGQLWTSWNELRKLNLLRADPVGFSRIEHQLLWLEQAAFSGERYAGAARNLERDLDYTFQQIRERATAAGHVRPDANGSLKEGFPRLEGFTLHSLPLAELFGTIDPDRASEIRRSLGRFAELPPDQALVQVLADWEQHPEWPALTEIQLLRTLRDRNVPQLCPPALWGPAVELRRLAEEVAVPTDERMDIWIQGLVDQGDAARLQGEDHLFAGGASSEEHFKNARAFYVQAQELGAQILQAWTTRDRVWAELPYLAEWQSSPFRGLKSPTEQDRQVDGPLLDLIDSTFLLGLALGGGPRDANRATNQHDAAQHEAKQRAAVIIEGPLAEVTQSYEELRQHLDDEYRDLLADQSRDARNLRRIISVLSIPLLPRRANQANLTPAEQRGRLLERFARLSTELSDQPGQPTAAESAAVPADSLEQSEYLDRVFNRWREHPALALLSEENQAVMTMKGKRPHREMPGGFRVDPVQAVATMGEQVRARLQALPRGDFQAALPRGSAVEYRRQLSSLVHALRAAAPFGLRSLDDNPVVRIRDFDLQQLLMWHSRRALDAFWGPEPGNDQDFFHLVVRDNLRAARAITEPTVIVREQLEGIELLLAGRLHAARVGLQVSADDVLLLDELDEVTAFAQVGPGTAAAELPAGRAVVFLQGLPEGQANGQLLSLPLSVPASKLPDKMRFPLNRHDLSTFDTSLTATVLFRNHEFKAPFVVSGASGTTIEDRPNPDVNTTVTLRGGPRKRAAILFVLDCSHSMERTLELENTSAQSSRLDSAKAALQRMLDQLASRGSARVGLVLVGHRVGWNTLQTNQLLPQTGYAGTIPSSLKPYADVEVALPLGRFDAGWSAKVQQRLQTVKPWGESPLYLALIQGLMQFGDDADSERTIIVITDGLNYQFNPPPDVDKKIQDVLAAETQIHVPIHIVGFGIPAAEVSQAGEEFGKLAAETQGSFVTVDRATALVESFERILGPRAYTLRDTNGAVIRTEAGQPTVFLPPLAGPRTYTATLGNVSETIELSGGEALELQTSLEGLRLQSIRYETGNPQFFPLLGSGPAETDLQFGIHRPIRTAGGSIFEFSIQSPQQDFVPRPRSVWLEVTPVLTDNTDPAPTYIFTSPRCELQTPVPVIRRQALNWPGAARRARVAFWCRPDTVAPLKAVPLDQTGSVASARGMFESLPGVSYQWRLRAGTPDRVDVVIFYPPENSDVGALQAELAGPRRVERTVHRFDPAHRVSTHTFLLDVADADVQSRFADCTLEFTSRNAIQAGARALAEPVLIDLFDSGDVLPLPPARTP